LNLAVDCRMTTSTCKLSDCQYCELHMTSMHSRHRPFRMATSGAITCLQQRCRCCVSGGGGGGWHRGPPLQLHASGQHSHGADSRQHALAAGSSRALLSTTMRLCSWLLSDGVADNIQVRRHEAHDGSRPTCKGLCPSGACYIAGSCTDAVPAAPDTPVALRCSAAVHDTPSDWLHSGCR
jgi:hypothetical protein